MYEWKRHWPCFEEKMKARLEAGHKEYGDESFQRPVAELLAEVEEEILDQIGWSFIALVKIWNTLDRIEELQNQEVPNAEA